jgi:hypothetical protein
MTKYFSLTTRISRALFIKLLQHHSLCVQMVECYIIQWLAAGSTSSNSQVLHDETGTHSEVPQTIEAGARWGGRSTPRSGHFNPRKDPVPLWIRGRVGLRAGLDKKISPPPGFNPWTVQPIANHYTNWAITVPGCKFNLTKIKHTLEKVLKISGPKNEEAGNGIKYIL